jgi:hypothetical protein
LDVNRLSQGQLVAAVSAIALFIISFLPWFGITGGLSHGVPVIGTENRSLWEAENPLDIYLLIVVLVALVPVALELLSGDADSLPLAPVATTLLAGVGTILIFYQLFDHEGSVKVGLFLGLIACGGIAAGGWLQMQEDVGRDRY